LEAACCGLFVVSTRVGGVPEVRKRRRKRREGGGNGDMEESTRLIHALNLTLISKSQLPPILLLPLLLQLSQLITIPPSTFRSFPHT